MYNNLTISLVHEWIKPIKLLAMNHISTLSMHLKLHHNPYCRPCHPPYTGDGAWRPTRLCCVGGWRGAQSHYGGCPSLGSHHHTPSQGESLATMLGDAPSYHRLCAVRGNAHRRWRHGSLCISVPAIYEVRYVWTPNLDQWVSSAASPDPTNKCRFQTRSTMGLQSNFKYSLIAVTQVKTASKMGEYDKIKPVILV